MTKRVLKWPVDIRDTVSLALPVGSQILYFGLQGGELQLWTLSDAEESAHEIRSFRIAGTGHRITEENLIYINTIMMMNDSIVLHIFEIGAET